ncbi:hypothetical protein HY30_15835 [Hyphomonas chukchiensis]|uniref:Uncharacterized protein n=1 Tax=Hyphomonas chukchiensis TaxID=1280947 RepID=A0A062UI15_9PROT|nr:hypothetical protein HY30_15835 [Hyphomonas chukchiensis]
MASLLFRRNIGQGAIMVMAESNRKSLHNQSRMLIDVPN